MNKLDVVWREFRLWDARAVRADTRLKRARRGALFCALAGAACGALAGQLGLSEATPEASALPERLGMLSALLVGLAAWIGRELLDPESERRRTGARALAESIKREVHLVLMQVPPYDSDLASERLEEAVSRVRMKVGVADRAYTTTLPEGDESLPQVGTVEEYVTNRVEDQIDWHERKVALYAVQLDRWRRGRLVLSLLAMVLALGASEAAAFPLWVPVVTTFGGLLAAHMGALRLSSMIPSYEQTAFRLRYVLADWKDGKIASPVELVRRSESILADENATWLAAWPSTEDGGAAGA